MIQRYAAMFGLGRLTHIDLPYEVSGLIPAPNLMMHLKNRRWFKGDTVNLSIGQGDVITTPIQLVRMIAAVSQNGIEVQPHVISSIGNRIVEQYGYHREISLPPGTFQEVQTGLRAAVEDFSGTAHVLNIDGISVLGKTGTAQTTKDKDHHAWFVGFTRMGKTPISFCVFLEHGGSSMHACTIAYDLLQRIKTESIL